MTHRNDDPDAAPLGTLERELPPSEGALPRLLEQLRAENLVRRSRAPWRPAAAAAAVLAAFVLGWIVRGAPLTTSIHGDRYVLLLYGEVPGDERALVAEYRNWAREASAGGTRVSGEKLADGGRVVGTEGKEQDERPLRGYFIIEAGTEQEAIDIARRHPHVRHGGSIIVRRIEPT